MCLYFSLASLSSGILSCSGRKLVKHAKQSPKKRPRSGKGGCMVTLTFLNPFPNIRLKRMFSVSNIQQCIFLWRGKKKKTLNARKTGTSVERWPDYQTWHRKFEFQVHHSKRAELAWRERDILLYISHLSVLANCWVEECGRGKIALRPCEGSIGSSKKRSCLGGSPCRVSTISWQGEGCHGLRG